jgi:hypothetical protein
MIRGLRPPTLAISLAKLFGVAVQYWTPVLRQTR